MSQYRCIASQSVDICVGNQNSRPLPDAVRNYLATRGVKGPWQLSGGADATFAGAVVIPALAEGKSLLATLHSLALNSSEHLCRHLVVVVVNHREDAEPHLKAINQQALRDLPLWQKALPLSLAWIDAASTGFELPAKAGGVGLARKIGMDLALNRLDFSLNPYLVCLDADTIVDAKYLSAVAAHFANASVGGAVIPFVHQKAITSAAQQAIDRYELYLRTYVLGLAVAGSPYAFHTVGSAMACRASEYARMGGMNTRQAAEDFYFLQQLSRICGVKSVHGTCVYPSPRESYRVPFGTGRSMTRLLAGDAMAVLFYHPDCFHLLRNWLLAVVHGLDTEGAHLLKQAAEISPDFCEYLISVDFTGTWDRLCRHNPDRERRLQAFHGWFDGLKTMKLIHHLSDRAYPRCEPREAVPPLLHAVGVSPSDSVEGNLCILRTMQNGCCPSHM